MTPTQHDGQTLSVGELCALVARAFETLFPERLWVRGEIHDLKRPRSGHVYFDLLDPGELGRAAPAKINVALFANHKFSVNGTLRRAGGSVRMTDGVEVRIGGKLEFHPPSGQLKFLMTTIDPAYTLGRLAADRDRLVRLLAADGLLDRNASLAVGAAPLRVGLVTSAGSAACHDFLDELTGSGFAFQVVVVDTRVQGEGASANIVAALRTASALGVDVVALVRGGGARTDLGTFDGEDVARAVATLPVPVWTGIGHEIDSTVADLVAHRSFKTPTACGGALVETVAGFVGRLDAGWEAIRRQADQRLDDRAAALARDAARGQRAATVALDRAAERLDDGSSRSQRAVVAALQRAGDELERAAGRLDRAALVVLDARLSRLDDQLRRLRREGDVALDRAEERLAHRAAVVAALDPVRALARGWSITRDEHGAVLRSATEASPGSVLVTTLADGSVRSTVDGRG
ncbi:MAG: exodeoxyribonuclease VII large subunit [Acidimicrobiia bacterium]|nr:exodeoxyribonuclease VII large subunit [Acidimicrobiia bacterium]